MTPLPAREIEGLRVNGARLWDSLMELAQIGATEKGGVCRLTLTDLDKQGRDLVSRWAREAGMKDDLRRALYRRMIDSQLAPDKNSRSGNPLKSAGRVAICGFAAFLVPLEPL